MFFNEPGSQLFRIETDTIKKQLKKVRMQMVPNMLIKGKDLKSHNDYAPIYSYMHTNSQKSKEKIKKLY